jgi:hypothetical protein
MPEETTVDDWWKRRLLNQETSAHPIFGRSVQIDVDGPVVTLSGTVKDIDEAEQLEREARAVPTVESVVNRLTVSTPQEPEHMQTVIAVFPDEEAARLASRAVVEATKRNEDPPDILTGPHARAPLIDSINRAHVPSSRLERFDAALSSGKALLMDRVPENDIFQVISALEGAPTESVTTLPPEPDFFEEL